MRVQVIHEDALGVRTDFGIQELDYLPPVMEPFRVTSQVWYTARTCIGPNERGLYLLILEGKPQLLD